MRMGSPSYRYFTKLKRFLKLHFLSTFFSQSFVTNRFGKKKPRMTSIRQYKTKYSLYKTIQLYLTRLSFSMTSTAKTWKQEIMSYHGYRLGSWSTRLGVQRFFNWPMWEAVWTLPRLKRLKIRFINYYVLLRHSRECLTFHNSANFKNRMLSLLFWFRLLQTRGINIINP